jgi:hypothetical protein
VVLRLANQQLDVLADAERAWEGDRIFALSHSRILVAGVRQKTVYSQDLRQKWNLVMKSLAKQFPRTEIIGEGGPKGARVFRLTSSPIPIRKATGELLAVSGETLLYESGDTIRTTSAEDVFEGSVRIASGTRYFNYVEFAGPNRLYFSIAGDEHITDLNGKLIARVQPPDGWGFRHGWSSDGTRLLFDAYQHTSSPAERALSAVADALGSTLAEEAKAEIVRVIDVATGASCFDLQPGLLLGDAGEYHADLSPSGRLIAVATLTDLTVYRLPAACLTQ